jgi:hypothetical protein
MEQETAPYNPYKYKRSEFEKKSMGWVMAFLGALLIIGLFFFKHSVDKRDKLDFEQFNKANIHGIIQDIQSTDHGQRSTFSLSNDNTSYSVYFNSISALGNSNFGGIAKVGDSISKEAFSDAVYLYKNDNPMLYHFNTP